MDRYGKILIGISSPELRCFANEGDILFLPDKGDTTKKLYRPRAGTSYFVSLNNERNPSAIGVVKKIKDGVTSEELMSLGCGSSDIISSSQEGLERYEEFLKRINTFDEDQPVALYLQDKFGSKEKTLVIRKAIVRGYDGIDLNSLFQFKYEYRIADYL